MWARPAAQAQNPRTSGEPTAGHQAWSGDTQYIFASPGLAPCHRRALNANVGFTKTRMRLVSFSATNFRSITDAYKIPIRASTLLLGRNNKGKSNVLRTLTLTLSIAMKALTRCKR